MYRSFFLFLLPLLLFSACQPEKNDKLFTSLPAEKTGLHFSNDLREDDQFNIIKYLYFYNGGGVAIGDVNNDELPDILLTANQLPNRLFINRGKMKFEDVTKKAGLLPSDEPGKRWKTGVTMVDINADGWLDIYSCEVGFYKSVSGRNRLFINQKDGTFKEEAKRYGLDFRGFSQQASFFDYDLDGDLDCFLLNHSTHSSESFSPAANRSERDALAGDRFFRNDSPLGFVDASESVGIIGGSMGYGLAVVTSDLNSDGWPDIYVTNDFHENDYLYLNNKKGGFEEVIASVTGHTSTFSMGVDAADLNNDGWPELMTLDMQPDSIAVLRASAGIDHYNLQQMKLGNGYHSQFPVNSLQLAVPVGEEVRFQEIGQMAGVATTDWSWSTLLADFDNDGWKDLFVTNGIWRRPNDLDYLRFASDEEVHRQASDQQLAARMPSGKVANYAFRNELATGKRQSATPTFEDVSNAWGLDLHGCSNGAAYADLDNDGDLDLVVNNLNASASIFQNNSEKNTLHNHLTIKLVGNQSNTFGIGTKVTVKAGETTQVQELSPVRGWQSSSDHSLVFGLAKNEKVDEISVVWPGGWQQILTDVEANQTLTLQAVDAVEKAPPKTQSEPIFSLAKPSAVNRLSSTVENRFTDFNVEPLMPWMLSTQGPKVATNTSGLVFICGAKGQVGNFLALSEQSAVDQQQPDFTADFLAEDVDAAFFDADGDGDDDIYVVSGGGEYREGSAQLQDRLYFNDGNNLFSKKTAALPDLGANGSCVVPFDFDGDNDLDLFIGSRSIPGSYGHSPKSFLLKNDGQGNFTDATSEACPALSEAGMVTVAVWLEAEKKLVVTGEWMELQIFDFTGLPAQKSSLKTQNPSGFWQTLEAADFDGDGDLDLLAGNLGLNSPLTASDEEPVELFIKDFDDNGATDPIVTWYREGKSYPLATKDALVQQLPFLKKKFVGYRDFAEASFADIFDEKMREGATHLQATELRSMYFENLGDGEFKATPLPLATQVAPIHAFLSGDFDKDGKIDALGVGNFHNLRPDLGKGDAAYGHFLKGDGKGNFTVIPAAESGFFVLGQGRDIVLVRDIDGVELIVVARNGEEVLFFRKNIN